MSHEILYTSAPRLLKPGMTGYGTVVSTRGISSPLADKLESLSGYRWAFEQGDPQARLNPVCHSHVVITVAGQKYHVLSRVADYGADYSGRSNKIAHHVALSESELTPGGPGWVLKSPGFCETRWDEQLKVIDAGRQPTRAVRDSADYSAWKRVTGDAGWAGGLAETVGSTDRRAVHVIFPLGTDTLGLVEESLNLLPHRDRWNVSFSTYYNVLPASVDCHWRFVLDGTPEATNLRRQPHQRIIDLCRPLGPAIGGELVQRARDGWQPAFGPPSHVPAKSPVQPQSVAAVSQPRRGAPAASPNRVDADVSEPTGLVYAPPVPSRYAASNSEPRQSVASGWRLPLWGTLLLCLLIGAGAGGAGFWLGRRSAEPKIATNGKVTSAAAERVEQETHVDHAGIQDGNAHLPSPPRETAKPKTNSVSDEKGTSWGNTSKQETQDEVVESSNGPQAGSADVNQTKDMSIGNKLPPNGDQAESHAAKKTPDKSPEEFTQIDIHEGYIVLPPHDIAGGAYEKNQEKYPLQGNAADFRPEVFGADVLLGNNENFPPPEWNLEKQAWVLMASGGTKPLATFRIEESEWIFQWDQNADTKDVSILRRCLMRLGRNEKTFLLSKPFEVVEGSLLPDKKASQVDLCSTSLDTAGLEQCLSKLSFGEWTFKDLPSEYEIIGSDSPLSPTTKPRSVVLKLLKDQIGIAELKIELQHQDNNKERPLSIVELNLMALIPAAGSKDSTKLWLTNVRNSETERFSLAKNKKDREAIHGPEGPGGSEGNGGPRGEAEKWIAFAKKAWSMDGKITDEGKRVAEEYKARKMTNPSLFDKDLESLPTDKDGNLDSKGMQVLQEIIQKKELYVQEQNTLLSDLSNLRDWRVRMNALTDLLDKQVALSFEVFYRCDIDGAPRKVTLGTVTTKLLVHTPSPDTTAEAGK